MRDGGIRERLAETELGGQPLARCAEVAGGEHGLADPGHGSSIACFRARRVQPDQETNLRNPRDFFKPLAIGAPEPVTEVPFGPSRMIHFFDASNEKMAAKVPEMAKQADILLGNLEDAVSVDNKVAAREGLVKVADEVDFGETALWTRVNDLASPGSSTT